MQIEVTTDNHIVRTDDLVRQAEAAAGGIIDRYGDRVIRVSVHLTDENAHKTGSNDKRCAMEVKLAGRPPEAVAHAAATIEEAIDGAAERLERVLEHHLGRVNDRHGKTSTSGGPAERGQALPS